MTTTRLFPSRTRCLPRGTIVYAAKACQNYFRGLWLCPHTFRRGQEACAKTTLEALNLGLHL